MYLQTKHEQYLMHPKYLQNGPMATLSDNSTIQAPIQGTLHLYPSIQCKYLVYPGLNNESLLSIGQIYNEGCIAVFDKKLLHIFKNKTLILSGEKNLIDGLWDVSFRKNNIHNMSYIP